MLICLLVSGFCFWILMGAISINFILAKKSGVIKEKRSIVDTASMLLFFVVVFAIARLRICVFIADKEVTLILASMGTVIIIAGTVVNIMGRLKLGANWGNHIRIYSGHKLVTTGIYRYSRHPLYASIIAMLYGMALLFSNPLVFLLNTLIFIPFMSMRAKQEDRLLAETFGGMYAEYKKRTRMFI